MGLRPRALVGVLAVLSLLLLAFTPAVATDHGASASTSNRSSVLTSSTRADRPAPAPPVSRAPIPLFATLLVAAAVAVVLARHRLDDDGDDWRSLLVGAPPSLP